MSFTVGTLSTSSSLVFGPSRVDIEWDGRSNGKISMLPVCTDTTTTAAYSVSVLRVFPSAQAKVVYLSGLTFSLSFLAGQAYRTHGTGTSDSVESVPFVIGSTLATATGVVEFELIPEDTNYTTDTDISTMMPHYYSWNLQQTRGTATQLVALGKITILAPNPYSSSNAVGNLVEAQTASFCIG